MLLAINTTTLQFSLALLEERGTIRAEYSMSKGKGHFGSLMPALDFLLASSKFDIRKIKGLVVAIGPGSFTGLRVGLSAAKGLCHGLDIPIIGISSLECLASQIPYSDLPVTPILDSRKGEVFAAQFTLDHEHNLVRIKNDTAMRIDDLPSSFNEPTIFIGNDFIGQGDRIKKMLSPRALLAPPHFWNLWASAVGSLGIKRFNAGDFDEAQSLSPIYLRPPDIRPNPVQVTNDS